MNLKRGSLALAAMILGVGFFGASQAMATPHYTPHSPCIGWALTGSTWPFSLTTGDTHFYICDGSYQNHMNPSSEAVSGVMNAGTNQSAVVKTKLLNAGYDLFVFKSQSDYDTYTGTLTILDAAGITTTSMSTDHPGPSIAILEVLCTNPPTGCTTQNYTDTARVTNHEVGHAIDFISGNASQMTGTGKFKTQFDADRIAFNALSNVNFSGLPSACASEDSNFHKLECWFNISPLLVGDTDPELYREFFAHCYATSQPSGGYPGPASSILGTYFRTGGMAPSTTVRSCSIANTIAQTP